MPSVPEIDCVMSQKMETRSVLTKICFSHQKKKGEIVKNQNGYRMGFFLQVQVTIYNNFF